MIKGDTMKTLSIQQHKSHCKRKKENINKKKNATQNTLHLKHLTTDIKIDENKSMIALLS